MCVYICVCVCGSDKNFTKNTLTIREKEQMGQLCSSDATKASHAMKNSITPLFV